MATPLSDCYYASGLGEVFGWTQILPFAITSFLSVFSFVTSELIWVFYGLFLHFFQLWLWIFAAYLQWGRPDAFCHIYQANPFPSMVVFYTVSVGTFAVCYSYFWATVHGWLAWLAIYIVLTVPSIVLVAASFNTVFEVIFSMGVAVLATWTFTYMTRHYFRYGMPYLMSDFPISTFGYRDTYLMTRADLIEAKRCKDVVCNKVNF